jgi:hypothetical protein
MLVGAEGFEPPTLMVQEERAEWTESGPALGSVTEVCPFGYSRIDARLPVICRIVLTSVQGRGTLRLSSDNWEIRLRIYGPSG